MSPAGIATTTDQAPIARLPVSPSPQRLLTSPAERLTALTAPIPSIARIGTTKIVASPQAAPASQPTSFAPPGRRLAISATITPTTAEINDQAAIRHRLPQAIRIASPALIRSPSNAALAAQASATLKKTPTRIEG